MKSIKKWRPAAVLMAVMATVAFVPSSNIQSNKATEIVKKAEEKLRGTSSQAVLNIEIVRPAWTRSIEAKTWSLGAEYSMVLITAPARDKGTVFLKRNREIWNYVPSIERNVKMPPSMMMQSWMGSDFNNDDLVQESSLVNDYEHKLLGEENLRGFACYKIEFKPKENAPVVWDRIVAFIEKNDYLQLRSEFYDEEGELVNTLEGFDIKNLGGQKLPSRLRMTPAEKAGHYTEMTYQNLELNVDLAPTFFTTQNMKRVR